MYTAIIEYKRERVAYARCVQHRMRCSTDAPDSGCRCPGSLKWCSISAEHLAKVCRSGDFDSGTSCSCLLCRQPAWKDISAMTKVIRCMRTWSSGDTRQKRVENLGPKKPSAAKNSDTGNRTPGYRVRGDNVSHYTISDLSYRHNNRYRYHNVA